ncbi:hypothetical protein LCGC14_0204570 [marine sediment metagenome]|uniref:Uncharacterized protein n=1 Tax=marine sediment metagenome TaxID=412755 RepID=A0A0F9UM38_9ZZZZ
MTKQGRGQALPALLAALAALPTAMMAGVALLVALF